MSGDLHMRLFVAAVRGDAKRARKLLDQGAAVEECAANGFDKCTPLQMAALQGHTAVVALLLDRGANIDSASGLVGGWGKATPLFLATIVCSCCFCVWSSGLADPTFLARTSTTRRQSCSSSVVQTSIEAMSMAIRRLM